MSRMKDWTNISLREYYKIKDLIAEPDEYLNFNLLDTIYEIDSSSLSLAEVAKYNGALDFLYKEVPEAKLKKHYTLNGRTYDSNFDLTVVTVAQFVDYQNYIKTNKYEDILSVFFVPVGHQYNDGYDVKQVKEDLLDLDFATVYTIAFFFEKQLELFLAISQYSLTCQIQKMDLPKEKKEQALKAINTIAFSSLVSYPISSAIHKKQILQLRTLLKNPALLSSTL